MEANINGSNTFINAHATIIFLLSKLSQVIKSRADQKKKNIAKKRRAIAEINFLFFKKTNSPKNKAARDVGM
jgi:hypothetical protein